MTDLTEKTLATERKYTGKIISVDLLDIELPDGRRAKREVIRHGNAVAILARPRKRRSSRSSRADSNQAKIRLRARSAKQPRRPATR